MAEFFINNLVLRHGAPKKITTTQGKCFLAEMVQKGLRALLTNHRTTTAYRPQANGQERLNHTLEDILAMYVSADHTDWDETLQFVTFVYNTSREESNGQTSFFLMYGREALLQSDVVMGADPNLGEPSLTSMDEYATRLQKILAKTREDVRN